MNSHPQPRRTLAAFTLIEMLTVITIIAILMGLLFPAINIAKDGANKARAKTDVTSIAAAVKAYYTEYGKYPIGGSTVTTDVTFGDTSSTTNQLLFDTLTSYNATAGTPNQYNPRGVVYYEGRNVPDSTAPRGGFVASTTGALHGTVYTANGAQYTVGSFLDPWGMEYRIVVDNNYDNQITTLPYSDFNGASLGPRTGVAVFSLGKDKHVGKGTGTVTPPYGVAETNPYRDTVTNTNSDDIVSWQ